MSLTIKRSTLKNCVIIWVVLWMVLFSKTVYFGIINKSTYQWVFYASGLLGGLLYGLSLQKVQSPLNRAFPFLLLFLFNALFYADQMTSQSLNELIGVALDFLVTAIICGYIDTDRFAKYYIDTMVILSLVSIPCFIIANTSESFALSFCQPGYDWKTEFGYSLLYTWGWFGTIKTRNSGPFWEPGAFQGFILLAILMLLYEVDCGLIKKGRRKWILIALVLTMITTGSTTGYVLLVAIIITQWNRVNQMFNEFPKKLRYAFALILAISVTIVIVQSGNIGDKIGGANSASTLIRVSDLINGFSMWTKNPLLGLGLTDNRQTLRGILGVSTNDSVGLSFMAYTYGIPFLLYYLYCMAIGIKGFFKGNRRQTIVLYVMFLVLHMTEGLWWLPVYLYIIFSKSNTNMSVG